MSRPVVPPPVEWKRSSVTLPDSLWKDIDEELEVINAGRQAPDRLSRDAFLRLLLEWSRDELRDQRRKR